MGAAPLEGDAMMKFRISVFECRVPIADLFATKTPGHEGSDGVLICAFVPSWLNRKLQIVNRKPARPMAGGSKIVRIFWALLTGVLTFAVGVRQAYGAAAQDPQRATVIVVVGAAGTPEYASQFAEWAGLWEKACSKGDAGFAAIGLSGVEEADDRAALQKALATKSQSFDSAQDGEPVEPQTTAALWLVLIGHGTFDGRTAKFNLRGPDFSADELNEWLKPLLRPVIVINTASSSGPFLSTLSAPERVSTGHPRVVITATKSGFEQNYTRFGQFLAGAIADPQADLDKDGQTSVLEAFLMASAGVDEFYRAAGRLATEHALLDDNGDRLGTRPDWFAGVRPVQKAQAGASLDGYRAGQFHLVQSPAENRIPPQLRATRDRLELEVVKLRDAKEGFPQDEYFRRLEKVLCDIARIYEQTDETDNGLK
jgi:hypothetical protein